MAGPIESAPLGGQAKSSLIPNYVVANKGALTKLKNKAERSKTNLINIAFLADSNCAGYNGTNAKNFWDAWIPNKIDIGLQSWRNNVNGGPQNVQSSYLEVKLVPPGIDPINGYVEAPWHPSRPGGHRWFGNMVTNPGGLGDLPTHDHFAIITATGSWCGFVVDRTSTGEDWESNKTRASLIYSIRGGNPDIPVTTAGNLYGPDGTLYPTYASPNLLHSPFLLELVDVTSVAPTDYGTTSAYDWQVVNPVIGAAGWPGVLFGFRTPWSGTIMPNKKTLVRIRAYANTAIKLTASATGFVLKYGANTATVNSLSTSAVQTAMDSIAGSGQFTVSNIGTNTWVLNSTSVRHSGGGVLTPVVIFSGSATITDVSGACAFAGLALADGSTNGIWMHGLESSGANEKEMAIRLHKDDGSLDPVKGVSPGMYQYVFGSYASRIGMLIENSFGQPEHPNYATYATASHTPPGLDILVTALLINSMGNSTVSPAYVQAKYMDVAARLDAYSGNAEKVLIIHIPPCVEGALSTNRDDFYTRADGKNFNDWRSAILQVQAAYPNTVIVIDHQKRLGDVAPSVMKSRYGKAGFGRGANTNQTNPLHFGNDQYGQKVAQTTVDLLVRDSYVAS